MLLKSVENLIKQAVFKKFKLNLTDVMLSKPPSIDMGDISFSCFNLAMVVKDNPNKIAREIAEYISNNIKKEAEMIQKVDAVGPYINFVFNDQILFNENIGKVVKRGDILGFKRGREEVVLEYSSPNTNKPQHIGHLRNNVLGDSLSRILSELGYKVHKVGIINDRGVHICKSILMYERYGNGKTPESLNLKPDHFVGYFYEMFEKKAKEDNGLKKQAQEYLKRWEEGDSKLISLWKKMNAWVYKGWDETYKILNVSFDKLYYESDIFKKGKEIVAKGLKDNLFYETKDGAVEIDLEKEGLGKKILLRSDGTSLYITQDLYLAYLRAKEYKDASIFIYVVGKDQEYHFKVLFTILKKLGLKRNFYHLSYGIVRLPEGKMSSREGNVVNADDLIYEIVFLAALEIKKRDKESFNQDITKDYVKRLIKSYMSQKDKLTDEEKRAVLIGICALKYYLLGIDPKRDIVFDLNRALNFEGDSGPYIMYTYTRILSIKNKSKVKDLSESINNNLILNKLERETVLKIADFKYALQRAKQEYNPAVLAHYLLELSNLINSFYHKYRVLEEERDVMIKRLAILSVCADVIKKGFGLLGIEVVSKM